MRDAFDALTAKAQYRLNQKGYKGFVSDLEIIGCIELEVEEYKEAVQKRLPKASKQDELLDIAWAAMLAYTTLNVTRDEEPYQHATTD